MKRKLIVGCGILIIIVVALILINGKGKKVELVKVAKADISQTVEDTGYVQAVGDYEIEAPINGRIIAVEAEAGDLVQKGQVLAVIENLDLDLEFGSVQTQIAQAQTQLAAGEVALSTANLESEAAERDLSRKEKLLEIGAITRVEFDETVLNVANLKRIVASQKAYVDGLHAQIVNSQKMLGDLQNKKDQLTVLSSIQGMVLDLPMKLGDIVNSGSVLAQVGIPSRLEVKTDILSDDLRDIKVGQKVRISAPLLGEKILTGSVEKIRPRAFVKVSALGVEQRRVEVIVALHEPATLKPGYEVQIAIETHLRKDVLALPREALRSEKNGEYEVFLVEKERVIRQAVKVGLKNQERVEILSGLKQGDQVVRDASANLPEGTRVK